MKILGLILTFGLLVTGTSAIEMDVREESGGDWILVAIEDGVCKTYDNPVIQINLVPGSNGGKSFLCRTYILPDCEGDPIGLIPSDHPLTGEFTDPRNSVFCWTECCWP
ncbi:hypothetical protein BJX63DRAFT_414342 [Aspergillus granulosus]|uniref:Uncharacterized protein n=1 Tax=Aspergillus granulosus TaxID=176169 RepID=A0ABR4GUD6_9EURO